MADIQQGLLGLQYSPSFDLQGLQEENVNLTLPPAPSTFATVFGTVTNGTDPIPAATVKLFDSTGLPYQHTITAADGTYTLDGIPAGTYSVAAVAEGYVMSTAVGVTVSNGSTTEIPLVCTADATLALGAIAGTLTIFGTANTPLGGAKITLSPSRWPILSLICLKLSMSIIISTPQGPCSHSPTHRFTSRSKAVRLYRPVSGSRSAACAWANSRSFSALMSLR